MSLVGMCKMATWTKEMVQKLFKHCSLIVHHMNFLPQPSRYTPYPPRGQTWTPATQTATNQDTDKQHFGQPCYRPQRSAHQGQDRAWHQRSRHVLLRREVATKRRNGKLYPQLQPHATEQKVIAVQNCIRQYIHWTAPLFGWLHPQPHLLATARLTLQCLMMMETLQVMEPAVNGMVELWVNLSRLRLNRRPKHKQQRQTLNTTCNKSAPHLWPYLTTSECNICYSIQTQAPQTWTN